MRDGIQLYTEVWYLEPWFNPITPRASVVVRSPYPRIEQDISLPWLEQGYAVVEQDMRGMEYSQGEFSFWQTGGTDGYDTIEWVSKQPWSNGVVFGNGVSADGICAVTELLYQPKWLKSQFIVWTSADGHNTCFQGGAFRESLIEGWLTLILRPEYVQQVKLQEAYSPWWDNITVSGKFNKIKIPSVHYAGWYDIFLQPHLDLFSGWQKQSDPSVQGKSYLVVTPHGHCQFPIDVTPFPNSYTTLPFVLAAEMFKGQDTKDRAKVFDHIDSVNFYVMAPRTQNPTNLGNYWTSLPDFPPFQTVQYYLQPSGGLATSPPTASSSYDSYLYNPYTPVPTWGGNNLFLTCGPRDQQFVDAREDVLTFTSDPLSSPLAITGKVTATIYVSSNREDTDFTVKLMDAYPQDNFSNLVVDGIIRMKWRDSSSVANRMVPGTIYKVQVDMWSSSWIFPAGHRIRLSVSSSNYPRFQAHINRFLPISQWTELTEAYIAENTLYHDINHPSYLSLPVVNMKDIPPNPNITLYYTK
jgi:predicted acyl esterase